MNPRPFTWLSLSFFGYFCAYGVFVPFFPVWLKSQVYGAELIGLVVASSYFFRFAGGLLFANFVKQAHHLLSMLRVLAWASVGVMALISIVTENFWLLFAAIGLFSMLNSAGIAITDTLATTWQQQVKLDYGKARLIGSAAYVVGVTVFGNLIGVIGNQNIVWILTALLFLYALVQMLSPSVAPADNNQSTVTTPVGFTELLKDPITFRVLMAVTLIQGSHAGYYVYSVLYWTQLGINVETTSLLWGLAVCAEILLFFFSNRLFRKWSISKLLYIATIGAIARWGLFSITDNLWLIALLQTFHSLTFALMHYAVIRYIGTQSQSSMAKLQSLYNGLANCAGVGVMTAIAGQLYPISGQLMFIVMTGVAITALAVVPRGVRAL